jgi:hypothetical protein
VGLVTPLPLVSMSFHDLGWANVPGRHFVLRGMSSIAELDDFNRAFQALDRPVKESLYVRRKNHKETTVFLHEWAHTLGALHVEDPTRVMGPAYSHRTSVLGRDECDLIGAGLESRLASRGRDSVDWTPLRTYLSVTTARDWRPAEVQGLLARLGTAGPPRRAAVAAPAGSPPAPASSPPAPAGSPPAPAGSPPPATAPPPGGATVAPAFVAEAEELAQRHQRAQAVEAVRRAASGAGTPPWLAIARAYGDLGAVTAAEEALAHAAPGGEGRKVAGELERTRRLLGLPARSPRFKVAPGDEPALAEIVETAAELIGAGQLARARAAVDAGLHRFAGAPGLLTMSCELSLRSGKAKDAARRCAQALAAMEELPRAHFLVGRMLVDGGQAEAALRSLRRSAELDPAYPPTWELLGEVYRTLGRQREFTKFLLDHPPPP